MSSFFQTLVVVGAGLSLANCGGKSRGEGRAEGSGNGGSAGAGVGGVGGASSAGTVSSGGTGITGGGTSSKGGGPSFGGVAGSFSTDAGVPWGGTAGMPFTQWSCDGEFLDCTSVDLGGRNVSAVFLPEPCAVDPSQPTGPADCGPGQRFQCVIGRFEDQPVLVNCECSGADAGAACECSGEYAGCAESRGELCTDDVSLCGCVVTCILI